MEVSRLKHDSNRSEQGDWVENIPGYSDMRLRVRGSNSKTVKTAMAEKMVIPENQNVEAKDRVMAEIAHEAVLLDWDGLTNNGEPVPYSSDLAKTWLFDPDYSDFLDAVDYASREVARKSFGAEAVAKNSEGRSSGRSAGAPKRKT